MVELSYFSKGGQGEGVAAIIAHQPASQGIKPIFFNMSSNFGHVQDSTIYPIIIVVPCLNYRKTKVGAYLCNSPVGFPLSWLHSVDGKQNLLRTDSPIP